MCDIAIELMFLYALAHTIAPKVFHKRKYYCVMTALNAELENSEKLDPACVKEVLNAYAELLANTPVGDEH